MDDRNDGPASGDDAADDSRRAFIRRVAYTAPALLTLAAVPAMAQTGSLPPPPNCPGNLVPTWDPIAGQWFCES